ncbi:FtsB family cell division protein [Paramaledivibacter caminithermalis]|jgi:cell division protein FtsL|uniref:Cell division protein FtsL n=1 Tax=Paramaledivibacter caminithermalis (strain DSM 15212 / CIP 107654 / DViRD3) TaxID=1121301 RepID=A0A1M6QNI1_PARC5|nr:septum formation initiator family protein [Paramaledivibacter caminithermalis]SHK21708.1 cell division protein FtsL [Paramaledivibacter caminithermalis DSM 15212]
MAKKNKRRKGSFLKRNRISIAFIVMLIVYLSVTMVNQEMKLRDLEKEENQLQQRAATLKKELSDMEKKIEESESLEFIEKVAREKLKMVKPNEIIYIIQD